MTALVDEEPYALRREEKALRLVSDLQGLSAWHRERCEGYARLERAQFPDAEAASTIESLPFVSVRLFKQFELRSIPKEDIFKTLYSSGTTGSPSRIFLDRESAALQSKILVRIMQHWIGRERLPMLICDHPGVIANRSSFSARGAGIQGLSFMGRAHTYALTDDMNLDWGALERFAEQYAGQRVLLFGFTFMVWQHVVRALEASGRRLSLPEGILVHSGGWKKLEAEAVTNEHFKDRVREVTGIARVHNFYGMVEQIGAIFVECERGRLHAPAYSDVLVRRPSDWSLSPHGEEGVVQLVSTLPRSYPGHSLLTEDRGVVTGEDDCPCGRAGKTFRIVGRLPKAEARGCSDTFTNARGGVQG